MKEIMINKRFGKLVVCKDSGKRTNNGTIIYECKCDCGNLCEVTSNHLKTGHTKSCGCLNHRFKDITGTRYGKLIAVKRIERKNNSTLWECKCDCGNTCITTLRDLQTGSTISCGCVNELNRVNNFKNRNDLVDGTMLSVVLGTRTINRNNTTGYNGVSFDKNRNKYVAQITFKRKNYNLGRFDTLEEAVDARKKAETELYAKYKD